MCAGLAFHIRSVGSDSGKSESALRVRLKEEALFCLQSSLNKTWWFSIAKLKTINIGITFQLEVRASAFLVPSPPSPLGDTLPIVDQHGHEDYGQCGLCGYGDRSAPASGV